MLQPSLNALKHTQYGLKASFLPLFPPFFPPFFPENLLILKKTLRKWVNLDGLGYYKETRPKR